MRSSLFSRATRLSATAAARSGPSRVFARAESTAAAAAFEPALPRGQDPAYDLALTYLEEQNALTRKQLEALEAKAGDAPSQEQADRIARLQVDAWVNDPATRRLFRESGGRGHMDRAVMRSLAERQWKKEGELDLVMQRLFQLGVIPDLLPDHKPTAALRVSLAEDIEAGSMQRSTPFASAPTVHLQLFHHPTQPAPHAPPPEAKYTVFMIDIDSGDHETQTFTQRLHYAKSDIPISVLSGETDLFTAPGNELLSYEPPAPARGSGKHRYVFAAIRQGEKLGTAADLPPQRENFDLRAFLAEHELDSTAVVGATLFRSEWEQQDAEHINATYLKFRGGPAPVYTKTPKEVRYAYPLSAREQRQELIREDAWNTMVQEIEGLGRGQVSDGQ